MVGPGPASADLVSSLGWRVRHNFTARRDDQLSIGPLRATGIFKGDSAAIQFKALNIIFLRRSSYRASSIWVRTISGVEWSTL